MATLAAPVEAKYVTALLNGLARRRFHDDTMYTPQYLHDHLFSDSPMAAEDVATFMKQCDQVLQRAASQAWTVSDLETFLQDVRVELPSLAELTSSPQTQLTDDQRQAFLQFWRKEEAQIHDKLVQRSVFNRTVDTVAWRIDLQTTARAGDVNKPTAIVELDLQSGDGTTGRTAEKVQFEADRAGVQSVIAQLDIIEKIISERGS